MCGFWQYRFFMFFGVIILCISILLLQGVTSLHTLAASSPNCASSSPPAVIGPLTQPSTTANSVVINEVLPSPAQHTAWNCAGDTSTGIINWWIELYNPQSQALDLYTARTGFDNGPATNTFYLPFGSAIAPHAFLVIFPSSNILSNATTGQTLRLTISGTPIDQVKLPSVGMDQSYARIPDGSTSWQITNTPTIGTSNNPVSLTPTPTRTSTGLTTPLPSPTQHAPIGNQTTGLGNAGNYVTEPKSPTGTQPVWQNIQLPKESDLLSSPVASAPIIPTPPTPQPAETTDIPQKLLLTSGLVAALGLILGLIWRRFIRT